MNGTNHKRPTLISYFILLVLVIHYLFTTRFHKFSDSVDLSLWSHYYISRNLRNLEITYSYLLSHFQHFGQICIVYVYMKYKIIHFMENNLNYLLGLINLITMSWVISYSMFMKKHVNIILELFFSEMAYHIFNITTFSHWE